MKAVVLKKFCLSSLLLLSSACSPVAPVVTHAPTVTVSLPTPTPLPSSTSAPTKSAISFEAAIYRDEKAGFEFDYPATWTLDPSSQIGVRGAQALLLSPNTTPETLAEGGSRLAMIVYQWDPKNDLAAYVAQRMTAWEASGFSVKPEAEWALSDSRQVKSFLVQSPGQPPWFSLFTTVGEDYLQISGEGDLALIEEIAHTLRL